MGKIIVIGLFSSFLAIVIIALLTILMFGEQIIGALTLLLTRLIEERGKTRREELRTRQIEAFARMAEEEQKLLVQTMPDWIDADDPEEVERWKAARAEVHARTSRS